MGVTGEGGVKRLEAVRNSDQSGRRRRAKKEEWVRKNR